MGDQAAGWLREMLAQPWLEAWQPTIAHTPDWALLVVPPTMLLLFALTLRQTWPWSRKPSRAKTDTKTQSPSAPRQSRQTEPAPQHVELPAVAKPVPAVSAPRQKPVIAKTSAGPAPAPTPSSEDEEDNRSVRVFVSSTFLDMQAERDELVTKAFPALRAKYRARGVEVFEVDLRWGITKEMQQRGETLPTLLAEIDRCRPYFIGLLGDRYGWVPSQEALTDKLKADYPAIADAQGASVTAMEIIHGVLSNPGTAERAFFFERDPNWEWIVALNEEDRAAAKAETDAERAKLAELKAQIRQNARVEPYARPDEIGRKVTEALDALLEERFPEIEAPDAFELTARLHRAYARERRGLHVGADFHLRDLNRWMETKDAPPKLIIGESGGGKSTLVANWLHDWRRAHPNDILFEHYLGASPDSADPMLLMRRLWEHLNRASGESIDLPDGNAELMHVSAGLGQRLAQARATTDRRGARLLIAFDGLDKLSSEANLRWLPMVPGVHVLASSLDGEAKSAALARGCSPLELKPLTEEERQEFIEGTLARWRRGLEPWHIARILQPAAAELAGSPLYLKTLLEELRVSADNARLEPRLEDYCGAADLPDLFDRVLARMEEDCEPGFVAKALPLIWAGRAGLEEAEIIAITGATPLTWVTLRNGLGDGLRDQAGRLAFSHDFLRQAVEARYLASDDRKRAVHKTIADRFEKCDADERQAEELPFQLRAARDWERLEALLVDLDRFTLLQARGDIELTGFWLSLRKQGANPESLLCAAFNRRAGEAQQWTEEDIGLALALGRYLVFLIGHGDHLLQLYKDCTAACRRLFGSRHPQTSTSMGWLAQIHRDRGELQQALQLEKEVLEVRIELYGPTNVETLVAAGNIAITLYNAGDIGGALGMQERILDAMVHLLGREHPLTLVGTSWMAQMRLKAGDLDGALELRKSTLETESRLFGEEDPRTMACMGTLAQTLHERGDHLGALELHKRVYDLMMRTLGPEHPRTLTCMDNLAHALFALGDFEAALELQQRVADVSARLLGPNHRDTLDAAEGVSMIRAAMEEND